MSAGFFSWPWLLNFGRSIQAAAAEIFSPGAALRNLLVNDSTVTDLVSTRIYPVVSPQSAVKPYGVYRCIDTSREEHMGGVSNLGQSRVQFDWFADHQDTVFSIMEQARLALDTFCGIVTISSQSLVIHDVSIQMEFDGFDPIQDESGRPIFRGTQEYDIWFKPMLTA